MRAARTAVIALMTFTPVVHPQTDPENIPEPPTRELMPLQPFLGSYTVSGTFLGLDWSGSLDVRPAVKGWYVESVINVHSGRIDRQLRVLLTWDAALQHYRLWRFETTPPLPPERAEGTGRFDGDDFIMEWRDPFPDGGPGIFRNRWRLEGRDTLVIITEGERTGGADEVVRLGVTTARRRMDP